MDLKANETRGEFW